MNSAAALELVRESVGRTRSELTAELWYVPNVTYFLDPGGRTSTDVLSQRPWHWLRQGLQQTTLAGRIEFNRDRALYREGDWWCLVFDGTRYIGEPGDWEEDEDDLPLCGHEPQWLIAIIEACISADAVSLQDVGGEEWTCLSTRCDFDRAVANGREIVPPRSLASDPPLDLSSLRVDVWLDGAGRIRRSVLFKGKSLTVLELAGFGRPEPIEPTSASV